MDNANYHPYGHPCLYMVGTSLCYIVSGLSLLVVGIILTSLTFHNLKFYKNGIKERYAGPVLIGAGILVIGRAIFNQMRAGSPHAPRTHSILDEFSGLSDVSGYMEKNGCCLPKIDCLQASTQLCF